MIFECSKSFGLFGLELARLDELIDEGLVASDLHDRPVPDEVGATVADLGEDDPRRVQQRSGDGRSHPASSAVSLGRLEDPLAGFEHRLLEVFAPARSTLARLRRCCRSSKIVSTAIWLATSPAAAPPMPSQTASESSARPT